jgi:hypothetical protein
MNWLFYNGEVSLCTVLESYGSNTYTHIAVSLSRSKYNAVKRSSEKGLREREHHVVWRVLPTANDRTARVVS